MRFPNFTLTPLVVGNNVIDCVSTYKILWVFIYSDLRWNSHVDYIFKKACRAGVDRRSILKVYLSPVTPVLEYAVPVWQSIPNYLSDNIESIQKRALRIIFPSADNYNDALEVARLDTLACRREKLCIEYMRKLKNLNHPLHHLLLTRVNVNKPYTLRHNSDQVHFYKNVSTCRCKRTEEFFTFKYF